MVLHPNHAACRLRRLVTLVTVLVLSYASQAASQTAAEPALKAAFLFNFAKFAEWPALPPGDPLVVCVVGDDRIAAALVETVRGEHISGHPIDVRRPQDSATWRMCHVLFIEGTETRRYEGGLDGVKSRPVLTVSDGKDFSRATGIIELYVEAGRLRFAINVDAAERSGLRLSSHLLGIARVVHNVPGQSRGDTPQFVPAPIPPVAGGPCAPAVAFE
jgi:hypothetical protein